MNQIQTRGKQRMLPRWRLALAGVLVALAACSPRLDWREMPAAGDAARVLFPARPQAESREVEVGGHALRLSFDIAQVDASVFAVGHATLPEAVVRDPAELAKVADGFEDVLRANLRGTLAHRREAAPRLAAGDPRQVARAVELEIRGDVAGQPAWLLARLFVVGDRMLQAVALGPESELTADDARMFVQSLRLD